MKTFELHFQLWLPQPPEEIFPFFADALNLEKITPPFLRFQVVTPSPIQMAVGTEIEYKLKLRGIPLRWRSRITEWDPPHRFADEQLSGPYRLWRHVHTFSPKDGGTRCEDHLTYAVFGGAIVNKLLVARDVQQIFAYRTKILKELFSR